MKFQDVKVGDVLMTDDNFPCIDGNRRVIIEKDRSGLYFNCNDGRHYLDGQLNNDGGLVGLSFAPPDMVRDIADFHRKFGIEYTGKPRILDADLQEFRIKFLREELREYTLAVLEGSNEKQLPLFERDQGEMITHMEKALDALVDLVYVALGTAHLHGFDFNEAWRRVHAANMKKMRAASADESKNSTGRGHAADVIKPAGWEPPSHKDLVEDHAHLGDSS